MLAKCENGKYVRVVENSFTVPGPVGEHLCLAFESLGKPLWMLGQHFGTVGLSPPILKAFLKLIVRGLDFLHSECHIIHTGKYFLLRCKIEEPANHCAKT